MPSSDDYNFHRKEDMENLSKIPVIENEIGHIQKTLMRIEQNTECLTDIKVEFEKTKTDVGWLKGWHWKIVLGLIGAYLTAGIIAVWKRFGG